MEHNFLQIRTEGVAFIEILILLSFIILTTVKFCKIDKLASRIMVPYILWVSFASILNLSTWSLNK